MPNLYLVLELNEKLVMKNCNVTSIEEGNSSYGQEFKIHLNLSYIEIMMIQSQEKLTKSPK